MSNAWRGIIHIWPHLKQNLIWRVGNGQNINIWIFHWLPGVNYLGDMSIIDLEGNDLLNLLQQKVINWDWNKFSYYLTTDWLDMLMSIKPPNPLDDHNQIAWFPTVNREFTLNSAYFSLCKNNMLDKNKLNNLMWKVRVLQRLKTFLWLVVNDALLTNFSRLKKRLGANDLYPMCGIYSETTLHILRDCEIAKDMWISIGNSLMREFVFPTTVINLVKGKPS